MVGAVSFGLMDVEENNVITRGEVRQLLLGAFKEANIQLTGDQVEELIDNTFEQVSSMLHLHLMH